MTVATRLARQIRATTSPLVGHGELVTVYQAAGSPAGQEVYAVMARRPRDIDGAGGWEPTVSASIGLDDIARTPSRGDVLVESSGLRWIVDDWIDADGMAELTLRSDPRQ